MYVFLQGGSSFCFLNACGCSRFLEVLQSSGRCRGIVSTKFRPNPASWFRVMAMRARQDHVPEFWKFSSFELTASLRGMKGPESGV